MKKERGRQDTRCMSLSLSVCASVLNIVSVYFARCGSSAFSFTSSSWPFLVVRLLLVVVVVDVYSHVDFHCVIVS